MLVWGNTVWRWALTGSNIAVAVCVVGGATTLVLGDNSAAPAAPDQAPFVDVSHALQVHDRIQRDMATPGAIEAPGESVWVCDVAAVLVSLRSHGLTVGRGQTNVPDDVAHRAASSNAEQAPDDALLRAGPVVNLDDLTRRATRHAIEDATFRFGQTPQNDPPGDEAAVDAQPDTGPSMVRIQRHLLVDVQIARRSEPIIVDADAPDRAILHHFASGFHGLTLEASNAAGHVQVARVWPATAIASNIAPMSQLQQLLDGAGHDVWATRRLGRAGGIAISRFEVIHTAAASRDLPVVALLRGHEVLPTQPLSARDIESTVARMIAFLKRRQLADGKFTGEYGPSQDRWVKPVASHAESALAAYALARQAAWRQRVGALQGPDDPVIAMTDAALHHLVTALDDPNAELTSRSAALTLLALHESPGRARFKPLRDRLANVLTALIERDGALRASWAPGSKHAALTDRAIVAAALCGYHTQTRDDALATKLAVMVERMWNDAHGQSLPPAQMLPWLAATQQWWSMRYEKPIGQDTVQPWAKLLRDRQINRPPPLGPADVVGGFDLTATPPGGAPQPDWRAAHVLVFLVHMMRDRERQDVAGWVDCALAARFIAQLMIDQPGCYYVRSPDDVVGGVRRQLWDNTMDVEPAAMALLALTELQIALDDPAVMAVIQ